MRILVAGFYGERNLGDDSFQDAIPLILGSANTYTFVHVQQVAQMHDINTRFDMLLVGGGDVVVPYFLDALRVPFTNGPMILFGAGLTYPSCVDLGQLDRFDHVFLRNTTDLRVVEKRLGVQHVHYIPDLAFALAPAAHAVEPCTPPPLSASLANPVVASSAVPTCRPRAGFCLIQSINEEKPSDAKRQQRVLNQLAQCIAFVAQTHDVVLIRFDTSGKPDSDDAHICETMMQLCPTLAASGALQYNPEQSEVSSQGMLQLIDTLDVNVCLRFHSHVFSIVQHVPFVSLSLTRKVRLLMHETGLASTCAVLVDEDKVTLKPLNIDVEQFCHRFTYVVAHSAEIRAQLAHVRHQRRQLLLCGVYAKLIASCGKRQLQPTRPNVTSATVESVGATLSATWQARIGFSLLVPPAAAPAPPATNTTTTTVTAPAAPFVTSTLALSPLQNKKKITRRVTSICKAALFAITQQIETAYLWGFVENMLANPFKFRDYLQWIIQDFNSQACKTGEKIFLDYMKQIEGTKFHRSGWPFVVANLRSLQSPYGVLCDTYVDRTFHWGVDVLANAGIVPYTQSWVGFVHHTPLTEYSQYNVVRMLENPVFRMSLHTCRGLFVLSTALKVWFEEHLARCNLSRPVPVRVLMHPTEMPTCGTCFSPEAFLANRDRKLIHIGAWLRDTFALYDVGVLDNADRAISHTKRELGYYDQDSHSYVSHSQTSRSHPSDAWPQSVGYVLVDRKKYRLRRCILRGRDMGLYLPPSSVCIDDCVTICDPPDEFSSDNEDAYSDVIGDNDVDESSSSADEGMCRAHMCRVDMCRHRHHHRRHHHMCRAGMCRHHHHRHRHELAIDYEKLDEDAAEKRVTNKWIEGLREHVHNTVLASVDVISRLNNTEYDRLLSENIVFLCLKDVSACNTLIECCVRKTPVLINWKPAIEEILGADYPFYYNSLAEALLKSRDYALIVQTHEYLCTLDPTRFEIETFLKALKDTDIYEQL
jgi:polysaccharide pyruvyl transferase WcaK-like protein